LRLQPSYHDDPRVHDNAIHCQGSCSASITPNHGYPQLALNNMMMMTLID
jgi:hypothetical protein